MKKVLTDEERAKLRPKRGKKIISEKQARFMANKTYEPESFLDDPSIVGPGMDESVPPTMEAMLEAARRNKAERAAEFRSMGKTGKEVLGDLPPLNWKPRPRADVSSSSESEADLDKENDGMEKDEEEEKEADETTPVAQQRSMGVAGPSTSSSSAAVAPIPSTPPARPDSGFRKPRLPEIRGAPRHSTPKMNARVPRGSLGSAFNDISIIANNSLQGHLTVRTDGSTDEKTRKESTGSTGSRGPVILEVSSIHEEEEEEVQEVMANGTVEQPAVAAAHDGTFVVEREEEREEEAVQVHVEAVVIRRQSMPHPRNGSTNSMEEMEEMGDGEGEERVHRVEVVGMSMRRQSGPRDVSMMSIDEEEENEEREERGGGRREESREIEDVEMDSVSHTPVRRPSLRPVKRPSIEHPLDAGSSPMAVMMAKRVSGLRETMVKPKVSMPLAANARKISTGSVTSSIPFEDVSHRSNLSMDLMSDGGSYMEPKTPERTPRTERQLRQSLAARQQRLTQQQRLPILEEADAQSGPRDSDDEDEEEEEEEEERMEMRRQRRETAEGMRRDSAALTTPVARLPPLSQKLQSSVDRLSQPRHRNETTVPCARVNSPSRVPVQRPVRVSMAAVSSPSPARRFHTTFNQTNRGIRGYTPNQRIDTTLMEDDGANAKSGMAPRIKRIPRRDQGEKKRAAVLLDESIEPSDIEEIRKAPRQNATSCVPTAVDGTQTKDNSLISAGPSVTPITSPLRRDNNQHPNNLNFFDDNDDGRREEDDDDVFRDNQSMASSTADAADDVVFARPANPLPPTPRSGGGQRDDSRRSGVSIASRRSMLSDADGASDMERLSSRASQISIGDDAAVGDRRAADAAAAAAFDPSFNLPTTPKTPFRRLVSSNSDLFSTDTPGVDRRPSLMDTEEEMAWADDQDSRLWRGDISTASDENEAMPDESQTSIVEEEDASARVLAPRKLIAPTASPGVRRSTRTRMKPVRAWLGEQAQYEYSPRSGGQRLVGVNEVVIKDKLYVKTGTADIQKAVEANKKTQKQRSIANKKRKEQKRARDEEEEENSD